MIQLFEPLKKYQRCILLKFYRVKAKSALLHSSEVRKLTKIMVKWIQATNMIYLYSVAGYLHLDIEIVTDCIYIKRYNRNYVRNEFKIVSTNVKNIEYSTK